ncbi:hypothetical protein GCM10022216_12750 [Sphingobacterium kyonggiense]|uniref:Outer membrane protein beta-barrel domain-containing protein n=1 Tax=Sphingobacterium kyonggiense TaxID=714075 RepID=A0ABP7YJA9_9SPHI
MKKLLLTLTAVSALSLAANAQTSKGTFLVGGSVSYEGTTIKDSDAKNNSFAIVPQLGYFVADNIAVGTGIGYNWAETESDAGVKNTNNAFQLAPFGRIYSQNDGPVKFYGQLSVPMSWGTTKVDGDKTGTTAKYGVELAPGLAFFPTSNIGIDFRVKGLYFNSNNTEPTGGEKTTVSTYGLNASSLTPTVGVTFHF